ncbi:MAG: pyridoxamine 5'-phosphate oxidase family protein [Candidatus Hodarchaeota archaeon]
MDNLTPGGLLAFQEDAALKFLATLSREGIPNVAPILSLDAINENTIAFGDYMMWKSKKNLTENTRVAGFAMSMVNFKVYRFKGDFVEFLKAGEIVDRQNMKSFFRYNAYTGVRSAGVINIKETCPSRKLLSSIIQDALKIKIAKGKVEPHVKEAEPLIHPRVIEKFKGILSFKCLAFKDEDNYPAVIPILSISPKKDGRRLVFSFTGYEDEISRIGENSKVAIAMFYIKTDKNLLSLALSGASSFSGIQPVAYQLKGLFKGSKKIRGVTIGVIDVENVFSSSPPLPGKEITLRIKS